MEDEEIRKLDRVLVREYDRFKMVEAEYDTLVRPAMETYKTVMAGFEVRKTKALERVLGVKASLLAEYMKLGKYEVPVACHHIVVETKKLIIVDPTKIPDDFWKVDEVKLRKVVLAGQVVGGTKVDFERRIDLK